MLRLLTSVATQAFATHLAKQRLKRDARHYAKLAVALFAIALLAAVAVGFAIAALFLALKQLVGAPWAALLVAGVMLALATLVALYACATSKRRKSDRDVKPEPAAAIDGAKEAAGEGLDALEAAVKRDPKTAVLMAVAAGICAGLINR
ncbi:MAG TPA: phage holin family protein [Kiloniellaceae bacterium]|nr:phage holin family protein [Kiloniellaceae bacterium]